MIKPIQQIERELENIESAVLETATEFQDRYRDYLDLLSKSVKQQLILASYQICTQFYPQSFLALSLSNKQNLQQTLRQIGIEIQPQLLSIIEQQELEPEPNELNLMAELIKNLPKAKLKSKSSREKENSSNLPISEESASEEESPEIDLELIKAELANVDIANIELIAIDASEELERDEGEAEKEKEKKATNEPIELKNPEHLLLWYKQIERKIKQNLDRTSKEVNKCLQNSQIIPRRIPSKIIDVAIQAEGNKGGKNNRKLPNAPNIIHLSVETDRNKKSTNSQNSTQISLLRLRLAEIEFNDPTLNAQRGQIRKLMAKISKLKAQYKAIKYQVAVAEAQAAWRSSWYED